MHTAFLFAHSCLPTTLASASIYFVTKRIPRGRYEKGEMHKRLLLAVLHIAKNLGIKINPAARAALESWVELLMEIFSSLFKAIAPTVFTSNGGAFLRTFLGGDAILEPPG